MREHILAEIKRLAEANGGKAIGKEAFERQTGIKASEWLGKYWSKWSDAVAEAGYTASQFKTKGDTALLLPKLAEAVRHFGRIPTKPELQMYQRANSDFPWYSVFNGHFGDKTSMYDALRRWALTTEGYADVAAMIPEGPAPTNSNAKIQEGFVYLIKSGVNYKIGRGEELEKRVKQVRTNLPDASTLEWSIRTDDPVGIEAYWHNRFKEKRIRPDAEWFKLSLQDVAAFKRRKYQ